MAEKKPKTDLYVLAAWLRNRGLELQLHEHPLAAEMRESGCDPGGISTHQIWAVGPFGKISVVRGGCSFGDYEIYSLEGDLFDEVHRFANIKEAGEAIHSLLTTGQSAAITGNG